MTILMFYGSDLAKRAGAGPWVPALWPITLHLTPGLVRKLIVIAEQQAPSQVWQGEQPRAWQMVNAREEQRSPSFVFQGFGLRTFILPEHFYHFPYKDLCLKARERSKMPNEACLKRGRAWVSERRTGVRGEQTRVGLPVRMFA